MGHKQKIMFSMCLLLLLIVISCEQKQREPHLGKNNTTFVHIPAGKYQVGSSSASIDEGPSFFAETDGFYIMETEVTNGQYVNFLNEQQLTPESASQYLGIRGHSTRPTQIAFTGKRYRKKIF